MKAHPIESFDPLLRDLATYGLVVREPEAGSGSECAAEPDERAGPGPKRWQLTEAAQARLDELLGRALQPPEPEKIVYFNHLCALCRSRALTRLRDGAYICDRCAQSRAETAEVV